MMNAGRRTGFAQKTTPRRLVTEIPLADDLQSDRALQIEVERLANDAHGTTTQLDRVAAVVEEQFIVFESVDGRRGLFLFRTCA